MTTDWKPYRKMRSRSMSLDSENQPLLDYNRRRKSSIWEAISRESPYFTAVSDSLMDPNDGSTEARQGSVVTIFAIWNTMMGTSILAMPWGIQRAGLFLGPFMTAFLGGLCLYTAYCNLRAHRQFGSVTGDISELTRTLLGPTAEVIAKMFSFIVLLGANVVYWILMTNFLYNSVNYIYIHSTNVETIDDSNITFGIGGVFCPSMPEKENISDEPPSLYESIWGLHTTVPLFLAVIIVPLLNFKSPTFFTKFNSLGTLSVMYLIIFVIVKSAMWGVNIDVKDIESENFTPLFNDSFPATSGMLALSFFIHNIIITIMRSNANQKNNGRDLSIAYVLVTATYLVIGAIFYIAFPFAKNCIRDNFLDNFASWDIMTMIARIFLLFQLVTVFPLISYMLRSQIMVAITGQAFPNRSSIIGFNAAMVTICILFAIFLPRIGTIIRFTGALSGFVHVFTLPCLLRLATLYKNDKIQPLSWILYLTIPVFGAANLLGQFFVSDS